MAGIFISYRRDESRHAAGRLADDLVEAFGAESIFRDIEGIEPGVDFKLALDKALGSCVVMLVLIGPRWLQFEDAHGGRRIDQPGDWIRLEIVTALARETRVIPVLLEGASLPGEDELPENLCPLVRRQAFELADGRWRGDLQRLEDALAKVPGLKRRQRHPPVPPPAKRKLKPLLIGGAIGLFLLVALILNEDEYYLPQDDFRAQDDFYADPEPAPPPAPSPAPVASIPDVSGLWRTYTGEVYHFEQNGRDVEFYAEAAGHQVAVGEGRFDAQVLRLAMTLYFNGVAMGVVNCDMQAAVDGRSYSGMCNGPNGTLPAQMFR